MKTLILILTLCTTFGVFAEAGREGGGGDPTESRFDQIRGDILKWIESDGHKGLDFPERLTADIYSSQMIPFLQSGFVSIEFTNLKPSPVNIDGHEKTCINYFEERGVPKILCDIDRFRKLSSKEEYQIVHHEYAGLAEIELNNSSRSDYSLSTQLSDFLDYEVVLRLSTSRTSSSINNVDDSNYYFLLSPKIVPFSSPNWEKLNINGIVDFKKRTLRKLFAQNPRYSDYTSCTAGRFTARVQEVLLNVNETARGNTNWYTNKKKDIVFINNIVNSARAYRFEIHFTDSSQNVIKSIKAYRFAVTNDFEVNLGTFDMPDYKRVNYLGRWTHSVDCNI